MPACTEALPSGLTLPVAAAEEAEAAAGLGSCPDADADAAGCDSCISVGACPAAAGLEEKFEARSVF